MAARADLHPSSTPLHRSKVSPHWRKEFLAKLAESSNVSAAARGVNIDPSRAYRARREEPDFARGWLAALWEGYLHLEMELLRRLREGDQQVVSGEKYDFANAVRLLTIHRDNVAKVQTAHRTVSAAEIRASIDRKIEDLQLKIKRENQLGLIEE